MSVFVSNVTEFELEPYAFHHFSQMQNPTDLETVSDSNASFLLIRFSV